MKKPRRWFKTKFAAAILLLAFSIGFALLWFDEPEPLTNPRSGESMQAAVSHEYGTPDGIQLESIDKLLPNDNQLLVRVHAAAANPLDWPAARRRYGRRCRSGR
jgi:hypothetical protein